MMLRRMLLPGTMHWNKILVRSSATHLRRVILVGICLAALAIPSYASQDPFAPTQENGLGTSHSSPPAQLTSDQGTLPPRSAGAPDVQVIVLGGFGSEDQINLTYPGVVTRVQVQKDIDALTRTTAWTQHHLSVTNTALPITGYKTPAMTSVTFTSPDVIHVADGHFNLEPVIVALRAYPKMAVTFITPPQFGFNGLRAYSDSHVTITLRRMGSAYTYRVNVQNAQFTRLNLPVWQADPATVRAASAPPPPRRDWGTLRLVSLVVITICAAAAGYGVYAWLARLH